MVLCQIDTEKQTLLAGSGHNYAWTNTYIIEAVDLDNAWAWGRVIAAIEAEALPRITSVRFVQARVGIGGPAPLTPEILGYPGALPTTATSLVLTNTARIDGWTDDGRYAWYKRWRGPLRPEDATSSLLSAAYYAVVGRLADRLLRETPQRTRRGLRIVRWRVSPAVRMWQLRDGSRRRIDSPLADG